MPWSTPRGAPAIREHLARIDELCRDRRLSRKRHEEFALFVVRRVVRPRGGPPLLYIGHRRCIGAQAEACPAHHLVYAGHQKVCYIRDPSWGGCPDCGAWTLA